MLHGHKFPTGNMCRIKLCQNIKIALGIKILAQYRAEKREFVNVMALAESDNFIIWNTDVLVKHIERSSRETKAVSLIIRS